MGAMGWTLVAIALWIIICEVQAAFSKGDGHQNHPRPQHSAEHERSTHAETEEFQPELPFAPPLVEQSCNGQHDIDEADEVGVFDVLTEWRRWRYITAATAAKCMTPKEREALKRDPAWRWDNDRQFWLNVAQGTDALVTQPKPVGMPRDWLRL